MNCNKTTNKPTTQQTPFEALNQLQNDGTGWQMANTCGNKMFTTKKGTQNKNPKKIQILLQTNSLLSTKIFKSCYTKAQIRRVLDTLTDFLFASVVVVGVGKCVCYTLTHSFTAFVNFYVYIPCRGNGKENIDEFFFSL